MRLTSAYFLIFFALPISSEADHAVPSSIRLLCREDDSQLAKVVAEVQEY